MKQPHSDLFEIVPPGAHRCFADVPQQHVGVGHGRQSLTERSRDCIFHETFFQSDAQIAGQQLHQVFRFQWSCLVQHGSEQPRLILCAASLAQTRHQGLSFDKGDGRPLIVPFRFLDCFISCFAGISQAHVTRQQIFNAEPGGCHERIADDPAADVGSARVAERKLVTGKVTSGSREIRVTQFLEIVAQQGGLFELLRRSRHRFRDLAKAFERVNRRSWRIVKLNFRVALCCHRQKEPSSAFESCPAFL